MVYIGGGQLGYGGGRPARQDLPTILDDGYPECATECEVCGQRAVVRMDGMNTCLACGHSTEITGNSDANT